MFMFDGYVFNNDFIYFTKPSTDKNKIFSIFGREFWPLILIYPRLLLGEY